MRSVSIGAKLEQIDGLRGTNDLSDWEQEFVVSVMRRYREAGDRTSSLTDQQVTKIDEIWSRHFA